MGSTQMPRDDVDLRWFRRQRRRPRERVGVPADHFVKAPKQLTKRQVLKAVRREMSRRRKGR